MPQDTDARTSIFADLRDTDEDLTRFPACHSDEGLFDSYWSPAVSDLGISICSVCPTV